MEIHDNPHLERRGDIKMKDIKRIERKKSNEEEKNEDLWKYDMNTVRENRSNKLK